MDFKRDCGFLSKSKSGVEAGLLIWVFARDLMLLGVGFCGFRRLKSCCVLHWRSSFYFVSLSFFL